MIESLNNNQVKQWSKLKQAKYLNKSNEYLVEGLHLIEEALHNEVLLEVITTDINYKCCKKVTLVNESVLAKISSQKNASGYIGVCLKKKMDIDYNDHIIVLDDIQDPGNLGTIIRNVVAFGLSNMIVSPGCVNLYNDKVIQASQGAIFKVNVIEANLLDMSTSLRNSNYYLIGTALNNSISIRDTKLDHKKIALYFGNEGQGISTEVLSKMDQNVRIPISGTESLNVACASAIAIFEIFK